jgi:hypothetical protein
MHRTAGNIDEVQTAFTLDDPRSNTRQPLFGLMFVFIFFADMAAPSLATPALGCMQEIQRQCFLLGIPLKTRHREVAPNQFEFAPLYGFVTTQIDQNLMVMQIIEETAASFGLAALFQEKPFQVRCNWCYVMLLVTAQL